MTPRREARAPEPPRQPRRQQPLPRRPRDRPGDAAHAARRARAASTAAFSPDGRAVYLSSNAGRDLAAFARIELDAQRRARPDRDPRRRATTPSSAASRSTTPGTTAALALERRRQERARASSTWRPAGRRPGPKLPAEIAFGLDFSRDGRTLALVASGAAAPADIWVLDVGDRRACARSRSSPHAGVDLATLVRPELVRFKAHDGLELSGWLYRPPRRGRGPGPIVLSFHGGPEGQERPVVPQRLPGAARARHRRLRAQRARLVGLRQAVRQPRQRRAARRRRQGHQGLRRLRREGGHRRPASASASWAARTAATW